MAPEKYLFLLNLTILDFKLTASLAALADSLEFELWTVKPPLGAFGASLARHGVHDVHRAHYRRGSASA